MADATRPASSGATRPAPATIPMVAHATGRPLPKPAPARPPTIAIVRLVGSPLVARNAATAIAAQIAIRNESRLADPCAGTSPAAKVVTTRVPISKGPATRAPPRTSTAARGIMATPVEVTATSDAPSFRPLTRAKTIATTSRPTVGASAKIPTPPPRPADRYCGRPIPAALTFLTPAVKLSFILYSP